MSGFDCPKCGRELDEMESDLLTVSEADDLYTGILTLVCIDCPGDYPDDEDEETEPKEVCPNCGEDFYPDGYCHPNPNGYCRYEDDE